MDVIRIFGKKLKALRKERGLTQEAVADQLNVSSAAYGNWERGQRGPDISNLPKIADFFKVSIDALFEHSAGYNFVSRLGLGWSLTRLPSDREKVALSIWEQLTHGQSFATITPSFGEGIAESYLKDVIYSNLIDIKKLPYDDQLGENIRKRFALRHVRVVKVGLKKQPAEPPNNVEALFRKILLAEAARDYYKRSISKDDVFKNLKIGISGGTTLSYFIYSLKRGECKNVEFYPLANSPEIYTTAIDANSLVGTLAFQHDGYNVQGNTLHYTSKKDRETASTQSIQAANTRLILRRGEGVNVVFMSVGTVERVRERYDMLENVLIDEGLSTQKMKDDGAVGDILFHFVNGAGEVMYPQINELICSLPPSALQNMVRDNIPVIILASEEKKKDIVRVAIEHNYANELIIDDELALAILETEIINSA